MKKDIILNIYKSDQTVFTVKELSLMYPDIPQKDLLRRLSYYVKKDKITRPRKGIYAKSDFNSLELANKIYTPSYISLETVLRNEGLIFQESSLITAVSYLTRKVACGQINISYRKIKDEILTDKTGVNKKDNYFIASKERAFLDAVFVYKDYHFDNLSVLDWKEIRKIKKIYHTKVLEKRVKDYYQKHKNESFK
ncbi:MAG: hypothetical protein XD98_0257 [Microgenomates bacterium 39_6]|nr:MAG: hypothetical protein XD98_0257 [Microgenomates bacterium 39_6]